MADIRRWGHRHPIAGAPYTKAGKIGTDAAFSLWTSVDTPMMLPYYKTLRKKWNLLTINRESFLKGRL
jgi:hypothetical protein